MVDSFDDWRKKSVLVLGFGEEGRANLAYAARCGAKSISIADQATSLPLHSNEANLISKSFLGSSWLQGLCDHDVVLRSPGVPLRYISEARKAARHITFTSGTDIFLSRMRAHTIGITGTKGKSTTSSLIHHILACAGIDAKLAGNIGVPALKLIDAPVSHFVLELSSYQLADVTSSPQTAVFLNLYPEHLDHHGDFQSYAQAKSNIAAFQQHGDRLVLPHDPKRCPTLTEAGLGERLTWGSPTGCSWIENNEFYLRNLQGAPHVICGATEPLLQGPGNQHNILAALAAISHLSLPPAAVSRALKTFRPLPHRLEIVATVSDVTYVNDSISTVPQATINALETFGTAVKTVILGGFDRGVSFNELADHLVHTQVKTIILFPPSGERIARALQAHPLYGQMNPALVHVSSMAEAVSCAAACTPSNSTCLLSPASPSFPLFKNFEERGAQFRMEVLAMTS